MKTFEVDGWEITVYGEEDCRLALRRTALPGEVQVGALYDGYVVDIVSDHNPPTIPATTWCDYHDLAKDEDNETSN